ncbi:GDYXXLXY domain-containing protein [Aquibium microcysteis]|uniref:GDYXXLXY domain-containing protein n=1 Tax=Aquibium microcysteis TaxID=675281 RepID=UPI00165D2A45|nr:GDYXXLXY domain-containing protein [Aquibium microcysteis]
MTSGFRVVGAALLVAALQIGFLLALVEGRASILRDGREVLLNVEPVDPRDLLRGDYVRLGYSISTLDRSLFADPDALPAQDARILVRLAPGQDGLWQAVGARPDGAPAAVGDAGTVEIAGRIDGDPAGARTVRVTYGIERFYLPEGQGKPIERDLSVRPFRMLVAVAEDGQAQIKAFFDGQQRLFEEAPY